jgi:hypothetical protein
MYMMLAKGKTLQGFIKILQGAGVLWLSTSLAHMADQLVLAAIWLMG